MCWIGDSVTAGTLTQDVPLRGENRPTSFAFTYTFRSDDATVGNVTFKAVATPAGARARFAPTTSQSRCRRTSAADTPEGEGPAPVGARPRTFTRAGAPRRANPFR
jgi:hypothetical protein